MQLKDVAICKMCGKEFTFVKKRKGRRPGFCSPECKNKSRTARTTTYLTMRYRTDPDFRKQRVKSNSASNKKRREKLKDSELDRIAKTVAAMSNVEEVKVYLAKHMRLKGEFYIGVKEEKDGE